MPEMLYPATPAVARVFTLFALRNVTEEPIRHIQRLGEVGGFDGSTKLRSFYGQLLTVIDPAFNETFEDAEMHEMLQEFKRRLGVEVPPDDQLDTLEVFCLPIGPHHTSKTSPEFKFIDEWCDFALYELQNKRESESEAALTPSRALAVS